MNLYENKRALKKKEKNQCGSKTHVRFGENDRNAIDTDKAMKKTN